MESSRCRPANLDRRIQVQVCSFGRSLGDTHWLGIVALKAEGFGRDRRKGSDCTFSSTNSSGVCSLWRRARVVEGSAGCDRERSDGDVQAGGGRWEVRVDGWGLKRGRRR